MENNPKHPGETPFVSSEASLGADSNRSIEEGFGPALKCLFKDTDWVKRFWIVPLMALLPLINLVLLRGWRFELTRRLMRRESPSLPDPAQLLSFFVNGLVLWFMTAVYFLPHGIFGSVHVLHLSHLAEANSPRFWAEFGVVIAVAGLLWLFTWPFYRVAMLRFAATGSILSFFMLPQNFFLILRNVFGILGLWLYLFIAVFIYGILSGVFTATVIGVWAVLILGVPMFYATMAHLLAQLGFRLAKKHDWLVAPDTGKWSDSGPLVPKPSGFVSIGIGFMGTFAFLGGFTVLVALVSMSSLGSYASEIPELVPWSEALRNFDFQELWRLVNEEALPKLEELWIELKTLFEKEVGAE